MIRTRFFKLGSIALLVSAVPSCGAETEASNEQAQGEVDPVLGVIVDGLGESVASCTDEASDPAGTGYDAAADTWTVALTGGAAVFSVVGNAVTVNGWPCYSQDGEALTTTNVKKINIGTATAANKIVFDLLPGSFGNIFGSTGGVTLDLDISGDTFSVRGSAAANNMKIGSDAGDTAVYIEVSGNNTADIKVSGDNPPTSYTFLLGDGNDSIKGHSVTSVNASHIDSSVTALTPLTATNSIVVYGGEGNDTLEGGLGDDTLYGGGGDDTFETAPTDDGSDVYWGGAGEDTMDYSTRLAGSPVTADIHDGMNSVTGTLNIFDIAQNLAATGDLTLQCDGSNTVTVTLDEATAQETAAATIISEMDAALECNVTVNSRGQVVVEDTTPASAMVIGGASGGLVMGGTVVGTFDADALAADADDGIAGEGDDIRNDVENLIGGEDDDVLTGSTGSNTIEGGAGNDIINGGDAHPSDCSLDVDVLKGEDGDDKFMMGNVATCGDEIVGGAGTDRVDYQFRTANLTIDINNSADDGDGAASENDNIKTDVEAVFGGKGADQIDGSSGDEDLRGGKGDDTLNGGGGDDTLVGHIGTDTLNGEAGDDTFNAAGADTDFVGLTAAEQERGAGNDVMNGGLDDDTVTYLGRAAPVGVSNCTDSTALTGTPNDSTSPQCTDDDGTLDATTAITLTGTVDTSGSWAATVAGTLNVVLGTTSVNVDINVGDDATTVQGAFDAVGGITGSIVSNNFRLEETTPAGAGISVLDDPANPGLLATILGEPVAVTAANGEDDNVVNMEWMTGTASADVLVGHTGSETLEGGAANDHLHGGAGDDTLFGDAGDDIMCGHSGEDLINGAAGTDVGDGGEGDGDICSAETMSACEIEQ